MSSKKCDEIYNPLLFRLKLAVAVACLRSKPQGVSGREFAQQLCDKFRAQQLQWKDQLDEAHTQILHLKQQLALQSAQTSQQSSLPRTQLTAQHDGSVEDCASDSQSLFPTPPASGTTPTEDQIDVSASTLARHTTFLHHSLVLQAASQDVDSLTKESLLHSLDLLHEQLGKGEYSWRLQKQCVECIESLLKKATTDLRTEISGRIIRLSGRIITEIADPNTRCGHELQERRVQLICQLSSSSCVTQSILDSLCSTLHTFSDHLRAVAGHEQNLDPYYFNNMYYILNVLEGCTSQTVLTEMSHDYRMELTSKLEDCLLHVSRAFPLFAHGIWRIFSKLNCTS